MHVIVRTWARVCLRWPHTLQNSMFKMPLRGEVHSVSATASVCHDSTGEARTHTKTAQVKPALTQRYAPRTHVVHEVFFVAERVAGQVAEKLSKDLHTHTNTFLEKRSLRTYRDAASSAV